MGVMFYAKKKTLRKYRYFHVVHKGAELKLFLLHILYFHSQTRLNYFKNDKIKLFQCNLNIFKTNRNSLTYNQCSLVKVH